MQLTFINIWWNNEFSFFQSNKKNEFNKKRLTDYSTFIWKPNLLKNWACKSRGFNHWKLFAKKDWYLKITYICILTLLYIYILLLLVLVNIDLRMTSFIVQLIYIQIFSVNVPLSLFGSYFYSTKLLKYQLIDNIL